MASGYSSTYDKPAGDPYAGDNNQQQASQDLVPGKDSPNPYETEEEKQKKLKAQQDAQLQVGTPTSYQPQYYDPSQSNGAGPGEQGVPFQQGSQQTVAQTPMISANGTVPPGAPYNPVSTYQPVAPPMAQNGQVQQPQQGQTQPQPQQGGTTPHGISYTPQDTTEFKWTEFAKKVLGQGDAGTAASGAGWNANPQAAAARNNLGSIVDQYNQEYGAKATAVGEDKIDFGDGRGPVDVISGGGNNSSFWFGSPQNPNGSSVVNHGPSGPSGPAPAPGPTTPPPTVAAPPTPGNYPQFSQFTPSADPNQAALQNLVGSILGGTSPQYKAGNISQFTPPDTSAQTGVMNDIVGKLATAPGPAQYTAPNQTAQNTNVNKLVDQISNANVDPYKAAQITQFKATGNPEVDAFQNKQLNDILSSPVYGPEFVNKLNESQKEMILQRGKAGREADLQDAARRGVTDSGRTAAVARRRADTETNDLLKSQRDVELNTTGANRQSILDALQSSQGILGSRANINQGNFASTLAGQTAQAGENKSAFQSLLDTLSQKQSAAVAGSGIAAQQAGTAGEQYRTGLAGETAAFDQKNAAATAAGNAAKTTADIAGAGFQNKLAGVFSQNTEKGREYQSLLDAVQQKNTAAGIGTSAAATGANIAQGNYASKLAGEMGQAGAQLSRDQFNQNTKQFDQNFIEQVRQFDAQLAQQMTQFNKSNELGWANNQQGYDLANLNSQDNLINALLRG